MVKKVAVKKCKAKVKIPNLPKVCVTVIGSDLKEFLKNLSQAQLEFDFLELRVDYINNFKKEYLQDIRAKLQKKAILTCRLKDMGGLFGGSNQEWLQIMQTALDLGFDLVDIDYKLSKSFLEYTNDGSKQDCATDKAKFFKPTSGVILSYHDFRQTPSYQKLRTIYKSMRKYQPTFCKFAVNINNLADKKILYKFLTHYQQNQDLVVMGMGTLGRQTRIICPLLGSQFVYASRKNQATASGQVDGHELHNIWQFLD